MKSLYKKCLDRSRNGKSSKGHSYLGVRREKRQSKKSAKTKIEAELHDDYVVIPVDFLTGELTESEIKVNKKNAGFIEDVYNLPSPYKIVVGKVR